MAPHYLLDTSILSDLIRHPQGKVASRIATAGEDAICTSIVVATAGLAERFVEIVALLHEFQRLPAPGGGVAGNIERRATEPPGANQHMSLEGRTGGRVVLGTVEEIRPE